MFKENKITNISITICNEDLSLTTLRDKIQPLGNINSYIAYAVYENGKLLYWLIKCNISQTGKYNKLKPNIVCEKLFTDLSNSLQSDKKYVVSHLQPDLTTLIKLYKPLIIKLAKEQRQRWNWLEMEDLIQMCNLVICDLYYKGYYVHKRLIYRTYNNYVLLHIRKDKNKPITVSLQQEYSKHENDEKVTIGDMIPDEKLLIEQNDKDEFEVHNRILLEVKDIVVDFIGPRQYDQLLREYKNKQTTNWSRKLMQNIKAHLFEMGISYKSFNRYYG